MSMIVLGDVLGVEAGGSVFVLGDVLAEARGPAGSAFVLGDVLGEARRPGDGRFWKMEDVRWRKVDGRLTEA